MSDLNYMHHFNPNRKGLCKVIVCSGSCHLPEDAPVHTRQVEADKAATPQSDQPEQEKCPRCGLFVFRFGVYRQEMEAFDLAAPAPQSDRMSDETTLGSDPTWLARRIAEAKLEEAKWWEHLVGYVNADDGHEGKCAPDCIYCERIASLEAATKSKLTEKI